MISDRSILKAAKRANCKGQRAPGRGVRYLGQASMTDVMFDQLEYLLSHQSEDCPPRCQDCERLKKAGRWLLLPFRTARRNRPPATPAAEPSMVS